MGYHVCYIAYCVQATFLLHLVIFIFAAPTDQVVLFIFTVWEEGAANIVKIE